MLLFKSISIKILHFFNDFSNYIKNIWHIAIASTPIYEYVLVEIELQDKDNKLRALIYYRAIGARTINCASAFELNNKAIFNKFSSIHAQMIVTLATIESVMDMSRHELYKNYVEYIKKCVTKIKYP